MGALPTSPSGRVAPLDAFAPSSSGSPSMASALIAACVFEEDQIAIGQKLGAGAFGVVYQCTLNGSQPACAKVCSYVSVRGRGEGVRG